MPRFTLQAVPATFDGDWVSLHYGSVFSGLPDSVIPIEHVEAPNTREALALLPTYAAKALLTGKPCRCTITLHVRDRAPNGWKKAKTFIDCPAQVAAPAVAAE